MCFFHLISSLLQKRRHFCWTSYHPLFLVPRSPGQKGPHCFLHCFHEEVIDRVRRLLTLNEAVELRLLFMKRFFDRLVSTRRSSSTRLWLPRTMLPDLLFVFFSSGLLEYCNHRGNVMLLCASDGPQPYPSSDKDSTRSQSAEAALQSVRVKIPLVLANVAFPPWKVFITAIPSSCTMSLNKAAAWPSLSGKSYLSRPGPPHHSW